MPRYEMPDQDEWRRYCRRVNWFIALGLVVVIVAWSTYLSLR